MIRNSIEIQPDDGHVHFRDDEDPDALLLEREERFMDHVRNLALRFPRSRFVIEHVSSQAGIETVKAYANVFGKEIAWKASSQ